MEQVGESGQVISDNASHRRLSAHLANEEKPPEYSVLSPPSYLESAQATQPVKLSNIKPKTWRQRTPWVLLIIAVLIGLILGLVLGLGPEDGEAEDYRANQPRPYPNYTSTATSPTPFPSAAPTPVPAIQDLAAAECEPGTFVFHQDRLGDIYMQAEFHDARYRNSSRMAPTILLFDGPTRSDSSNMTVVCWHIPEQNLAVRSPCNSPEI